MEKRETLCYKLARPDGYDFYTGKTINYRGDGNYPHIVKVPHPNSSLGVCSEGVIHASIEPNDCFVRAKIPCSAYRVKGIPVCGNEEKYGFLELTVLEEIDNLDELFDWRYSETINPVNPLRLPKIKPSKNDVALLKDWASVRASLWYSVGVSVGNSLRDSVWNSLGAPLGYSLRASLGNSLWTSLWYSVGVPVRDSFWDSLGNSVRDLVGAYSGYLLAPVVKHWLYVEQEDGIYPFQSAVDLWKRGLVPSFDGKIWRLHSGERADIVWQEEVKFM